MRHFQSDNLSNYKLDYFATQTLISNTLPLNQITNKSVRLVRHLEAFKQQRKMVIPAVVFK